MNYSNLKTEEDFRSLIENFNIKSRNDFNKRFYTAYKKFLKLDNDIKDRILPSLVVTNPAESLDDFKKFIDENNILTRSQFYKTSPNMYRRFKRFSKKDQNSILLKTRHEYDLNLITSFEYIKKFIKENNIKDRTGFSKFSDVVYRKGFLKLSEYEQEKLLPVDRFFGIETVDDFKKFIIENDIKSRTDFGNRFLRLYKRFLENLTTEEQSEIIESCRKDLSSLVDYSGFLKYIKENNILSRQELQNKSSAGYHRFKVFLSTEEQDLLLPVNKLSTGELFLMKLFDKNKIKYTTQKVFKDLVGEKGTHLRYDFFLPDYNILIEYHGQQHFDPNDNLYKEDYIIRDKKKFEYAKSNNIKILYFTNEINTYKKFGYFTEVITDGDILIKEIKN